MESSLNLNIKEALSLTNDTFNILINEIINHFKKEHEIENNYTDSQIYGFGSYDPLKPCLKNDLEQILKGYVNGKYLYNKSREASTGKPVIKISKEYRSVLFKYIGYQDIFDFLSSSSINEKDKKIQLSLLGQKNVGRDYYYVCYLYSEDRKMNKGIAVFYNNYKTVEMKFVYTELNGEKYEYKFYANVINSGSFIFIDSKIFMGNKKIEGARLVFFTGKSSTSERYFLKGTYSGFDKYDRVIAGVMILQRFDTLNEVEEELDNSDFNPIIAQELNQKRIIVESNIIKKPIKLSKNAPFAKLLLSTAGDYKASFNVNHKKYNLNFRIEKHHYNIISLEDSIIIENDKVKVINNGQILKLDFNLKGVFFIQAVSIYISMSGFTQNEKSLKGNFNGVDINNNLISGEIFLN